MECNIPQKWNIFSIIPFTSMPAWIIQKPPPVRATTRLRMPSVTDRSRGDDAPRRSLHSCALLPLIPPSPFSHKGRRGSLGILMAETGDDTQGLAKKSTLVSLIPVRLPAAD
jgi:hypothetical protein